MQGLRRTSVYILREIFTVNLQRNLLDEGFRNYLSCLNGDFVLWNLLRTGEFTEEDITSYLNSMVLKRPLKAKEKYLQAAVHMIDLKSVSMKHLYDKNLDMEGLENEVDQYGYLRPGYISLRNALSGVLNSDCEIVQFRGGEVYFVQLQARASYFQLADILHHVYKEAGYYVSVQFSDSKTVFMNDFFINPSITSEELVDYDSVELHEDLYSCFRFDDCTRREWDLMTLVQGELDHPGVYEVSCKSNLYLFNFKYARERIPLDVHGLASEDTQVRIVRNFLKTEHNDIRVGDENPHDIKGRWFHIKDIKGERESYYDAKTEILIYRGGYTKPFLIVPRTEIKFPDLVPHKFEGGIRYSELPVVLAMVERISDMMYMSQDTGCDIDQIVRGIYGRMTRTAPEWLISCTVDILGTRLLPFRLRLELPRVIVPEGFVITAKMRDYICELPDVEHIEFVAIPAKSPYDTDIFYNIDLEDVERVENICQNFCDMVDPMINSRLLTYAYSSEITEEVAPCKQSLLTIIPWEITDKTDYEWLAPPDCKMRKNFIRFVMGGPGRKGFRRDDFFSLFDPKYYGLKLNNQNVKLKLTNKLCGWKDRYIRGRLYKSDCMVALNKSAISVYSYEKYSASSRDSQLAWDMLQREMYGEVAKNTQAYVLLWESVQNDYQEFLKKNVVSRDMIQRSCIDWDDVFYKSWDE